MKTIKVSIIIITFNSEAYLLDCLNSVRWADEWIILDSGSSDRTIDIARDFGASIHIRTDWLGFGVQKNRALDLATGDWIISLDSDEVLSPGLGSELQSIFLQKHIEHDAYILNRINNFCGYWLRHGSAYPDPVLRVFRRHYARFSDDVVHERLVLNEKNRRSSGRVAYCRNDLLHYSYTNFEQVLSKMNTYSTDGAMACVAKGKKSLGIIEAIVRGCWTFLRAYIFRAGFLDGRYGFLHAVSQSITCFYKYVKLAHIQKQAKP
jgi:glycosyltransferase involved in cell wall biosynthesis